MKEIGLYIHIPFCKQKCLYCDFNSYVCDDYKIQSYIDALIKEIKMYNDNQQYKYRTVFLGGGTPTFINYKHIGKIMSEIQPFILPEAEISMECNPGTLTDENLRAYKDMGINRLSIGLQAWQPELQKSIGRIHDTNQFLESFYRAVQTGFTNISVDLMFALPAQTMEMWLETVEETAKLGVKHLSCYSLKIEEGTPFYKLYEQNKLKLPGDEIDRDMYHAAIDLLKKYNLKQYEISNFAVPGYECRHNLIYWENQEYLGVGAGSHSKIDGVRFNNYSSLEQYAKCIDEGLYPIEERNIIAAEEDMWETIILMLRLNKGLDIIEFNKKYKVDFKQIYNEAINKLLRDGLIELNDSSIKLTALGIDLSNRVFIEFLE